MFVMLLTHQEFQELDLLLTLLHNLASRYDCPGPFKGWGSKETIHCFYGSVCIQEGDTSESIKVLIII